MEHKKIKITKSVRGEDGYRVLSVRMKTEMLEALAKIAEESGRSRNELINAFVAYGLENYEIVE